MTRGPGVSQVSQDALVLVLVQDALVRPAFAGESYIMFWWERPPATNFWRNMHQTLEKGAYMLKI